MTSSWLHRENLTTDDLKKFKRKLGVESLCQGFQKVLQGPPRQLESPQAGCPLR